MKMIHEDPEFGDLLRVVATAQTLSLAAVETDYWLTHELWSMQARGLPLWLTGVTSLSKGFGLIDRLSEVLEVELALEDAACTKPSVTRSPSSFVHDELCERGLLVDYIDNRPRDVPCLHPLVILLEKLDELSRCVHDHAIAPAKFVRHFDDAVRIIRAQRELPPLPRHGHVRTLALYMVAQQQLTRVCSASDAAFAPSATARWREIRSAHRAASPMFWGPRAKMAEACAEIRAFIKANLEPDAP